MAVTAARPNRLRVSISAQEARAHPLVNPPNASSKAACVHSAPPCRWRSVGYPWLRRKGLQRGQVRNPLPSLNYLRAVGPYRARIGTQTVQGLYLLGMCRGRPMTLSRRPAFLGPALSSPLPSLAPSAACGRSRPPRARIKRRLQAANVKGE